MHEIRDEVLFAYRGHHQVRPRSTWLEAGSPVYIDFGEDYLLKMETYDESGLPCIRVVKKRDFVAEVMEETEAKAVLNSLSPSVRPTSAPEKIRTPDPQIRGLKVIMSHPLCLEVTQWK